MVNSVLYPKLFAVFVVVHDLREYHFRFNIFGVVGIQANKQIFGAIGADTLIRLFREEFKEKLTGVLGLHSLE